MSKIGSFLLVLAIAASGVLPANAVPVQATATWGAPTTGSPVHHYRIELKTDDGDFVLAGMPVGTTAPLTLESGHTYVLRVAGIDAKDRQGPWAESDPFTPDLGAPGSCGKPSIVQNTP